MSDSINMDISYSESYLFEIEDSETAFVDLTETNSESNEPIPLDFFDMSIDTDDSEDVLIDLTDEEESEAILIDLTNKEDKPKPELTDLPEEILELILSNMEIEELIGVCDVSEQFERISSGIINQRNIPMEVIFEGLDKPNHIEIMRLRNGFVQFKVGGGICRFLSLFSTRIQKLTLHFDRVDKMRQKEIMHYVLVLCNQYITNLMIFDLSTTIPFKPVVFPNLVYLSLNSCYLNGAFTRLSILFPNVRDIFLSGRTYSKPYAVRRFIKRYPHLEYMKVSPDLLDAVEFSHLKILNQGAFFGYFD